MQKKMKYLTISQQTTLPSINIRLNVFVNSLSRDKNKKGLKSGSGSFKFFLFCGLFFTKTKLTYFY